MSGWITAAGLLAGALGVYLLAVLLFPEDLS